MSVLNWEDGWKRLVMYDKIGTEKILLVQGILRFNLSRFYQDYSMKKII